MSKISARGIQILVAGTLVYTGFQSFVWTFYVVGFAQSSGWATAVSSFPVLGLLIAVGMLIGKERAILWAQIYFLSYALLGVGGTIVESLSASYALPRGFLIWRIISDLLAPTILFCCSCGVVHRDFAGRLTPRWSQPPLPLQFRMRQVVQRLAASPRQLPAAVAQLWIVRRLMRAFIKIVIELSLLLPVLALAKGNGVGFTMEGTLTNFSASGETCHFTFSGTFHITHWYGVTNSTVEIDCKQGFSASVTQCSFFVATHPTLNVAAVRNDPQALSAILKVAAERGRVIQFELADPKISFGDRGSITNLECAVVRATDWDLH